MSARSYSNCMGAMENAGVKISGVDDGAFFVCYAPVTRKNTQLYERPPPTEGPTKPFIFCSGSIDC